MQLGFKEIIENTLKPGAVYKYEDTVAIKTAIPHYFIVINNKPQEEPILLMVCLSSQVEKTRKRAKKRQQNDNTFVMLTKKEYTFLKTDSIIDCNNIYLKSKAWLIHKCSSGKFDIEKELAKSKLNEIQKAFLNSTRHDNAKKRIIKPDYG